ncbi:MAG: hypothetical protein ACP5N7_06355 [Candidatus Pacearchaeota archaeon]
MVRRANIVMDNIIHIIIFTMFFAIIFWGVSSYSDGSALLEDIYAKEIARVINTAEPGMSFKIDISKIASVAYGNGKKFEDIVTIDNVQNEVRVSSRLNTGTSYKFFNDVDIINFEVKPVSGKDQETMLFFEVVEKQRAEA